MAFSFPKIALLQRYLPVYKTLPAQMPKIAKL